MYVCPELREMRSRNAASGLYASYRRVRQRGHRIILALDSMRSSDR